jgi:hypothetical protein
VLVGVVMFVLALTILGISLFSLSSYEAQFFGRSNDDAAAFYAALGGIERAKFAVLRTKNLTAAGQNLPIGDIVYARACKYPHGTPIALTDTLGPFNWGQQVEVRVLAVHNGQRRMIEQRFTLDEPKTVYRRLITAYNGVKIVSYEPGDPQDAAHYRPPQTFVDGECHQYVSDITWDTMAQTDPGFTRTVIANESVPHPDVVNYRASHLASAITVPPNGNQGQGLGTHKYNLTAGGNGTTTFYETSGLNGISPYTNDQYSVFVSNGAAPQITVSGTAIWLMQYGFWSDPPVNVVPAAGAINPVLIMVAGTPSGPPIDNAAEYFLGGLNSTVPVILVTDGGVDIEMLSQPNASMTIPYLSIFADRVLLGGPLPPAATYSAHFIHPSTFTAIDNILDALYDLGLLPNSNAGLSASAPPVHRTWRTIDPASASTP